ncbi:hypothetical protein NPA07_05585 [Mycoplasmopsis caviae]|uniref:Uncharacterized protein n=1 Tax=Mycoplasmopsis caviae TaxID=55603 RepID=A0A3P8MF88_9BACT|nr:hypothetical protein [Mycoplasmopsis caviae]UUD35243.1 hypothetical protein NPA07_05585 [Mycoplasmopsis caviae]VDR41973.1 Uncharacterised protein [Mycoplasmopsis caviae]
MEQIIWIILSIVNALMFISVIILTILPFSRRIFYSAGASRKMCISKGIKVQDYLIKDNIRFFTISSSTIFLWIFEMIACAVVGIAMKTYDFEHKNLLTVIPFLINVYFLFMSMFFVALFLNNLVNNKKWEKINITLSDENLIENKIDTETSVEQECLFTNKKITFWSMGSLTTNKIFKKPEKISNDKKRLMVYRFLLIDSELVHPFKTNKNFDINMFKDEAIKYGIIKIKKTNQ